MPSIYELKPRFQGLLRPLVRSLAAAGVTANAVTVSAALGSLFCGLAIALGPRPLVLALLPAWLFARMALNAIDGMLAREHAQQSRLGAVLNEVGDVVSDTFLYLPLALLPDAAIPAVAFAVCALLTEFCGLLGIVLGGVRQNQGPMGKSDRAFVVGAAGLVSALHPPALRAWPWLLSAATVLAAWTCGRRCRGALAAAA